MRPPQKKVGHHVTIGFTDDAVVACHTIIWTHYIIDVLIYPIQKYSSIVVVVRSNIL